MSETQQGFVETIYGRMPGCPICGMIPLTAPHICEHGVTAAPRFDITITFEYPVRLTQSNE